MDQLRTLPARQIKRETLWASQWLEMLLVCMPIIDKAPLPKAARVWLDKKLRLLAGFVAHAVFIRAALLQRS
ncbi:MAG: hypothetical protein ABWZ40_13505, partial [Caulobacterales bacterium]